MLPLSEQQKQGLHRAIKLCDTPTKMNNTTLMTKVKDCKHSTPFRATNPDAPVGTIYISNKHLLGLSMSVTQSWDENTVTFSIGA